MIHDIKTLRPHDLTPQAAILVGTRPGIIMMAPIIHAFEQRGLPHFLIHSGQHYSPNMDAQFFAELELRAPDYRLQAIAEKTTHGGQTAAMLEAIETVLLARRPCLLLVGGDANTNLAGALAARKLHINVAHVEAGERSFDWQMPEEHNRVVIDHISDHLFATDANSVANLGSESVRGRVHCVGNPIVDATLHHVGLALRRSQALARFALDPGGYAVMTTHREENVDVSARLRGALEGVSAAAQTHGLAALFPVHPRTRKRLDEFGLTAWAHRLPALVLTEAVGYLDFLALLANARLVFTDSGGVQQEACIHGIPCVTLRDTTEWTQTLTIGANRLAGCDPARIAAAAAEALAAPRGWQSPFAAGAAARIADVSKRIIADYPSRGRAG
jgi:UDP-N-acetylglucosamine 2-epimerase (non-hydrolysing)